MKHVARLSLLVLAAALSASPQESNALGTAPVLAETGRAYVFPVRTIKEIKQSLAFRTTVHQQFDFSCGSAAIATLLTHHYARPVKEAEVFQAMFANGDQAKIRVEGFSLLDMKRYLDSHGYRADGVQVTLDELAKAGVPAIALISDNGYKHFVVVKGMQGSRVVLGDPALGTRIISREQFDGLWVGGIFFVIRDHRDLARFNARDDWSSRLVAPLALGVLRNGIGEFALGVPGPDRF
ncbi:MAG: C39 family peptidase [Gammaproteobacteria bacterium]